MAIRSAADVHKCYLTIKCQEMEFQSPFLSYFRRRRVSNRPELKVGAESACSSNHLEWRANLRETICSDHEVTKNALVQPTFWISLHDTAISRIGPLPLVNMKCIFCILSVLDSFMSYFSFPSHIITPYVSPSEVYVRAVASWRRSSRSSSCDSGAQARKRGLWLMRLVACTAHAFT